MSKHEHLIERIVEAEKELQEVRAKISAYHKVEDEACAAVSRASEALRNFYGGKIDAARKEADIDPQRVISF